MARPAWGYEVDPHAMSDARKVLRQLGMVRHGFFQFSGHVEEVDVYFRPAGTNYQQATERRAPVRSHSVYTSADMHDSEADMLRALRELHAFAKEHLAQPGKEAA